MTITRPQRAIDESNKMLALSLHMLSPTLLKPRLLCFETCRLPAAETYIHLDLALANNYRDRTRTALEHAVMLTRYYPEVVTSYERIPISEAEKLKDALSP